MEAEVSNLDHMVEIDKSMVYVNSHLFKMWKMIQRRDLKIIPADFPALLFVIFEPV